MDTKDTARAIADSALAVWELGRQILAGVDPRMVAEALDARARDLLSAADELRGGARS